MTASDASPFRPTDNIVSWGRVVHASHNVASPRFLDELAPLLQHFTSAAPGLAIGLRRSYGDSNINPGGRLIDMTRLDRIMSLDRAAGIVRAEAGLSLSQALRVLAPAGWFLPTTPGTRFVTLGGAIANDVHGKNHHSASTFGASVTRVRLRRTDGSVREIAPGDELFAATIGGLGLTGVIEWVEFQAARIPSTWLDAEDTPFGNVDEYFVLMQDKKHSFEHAAAWIDCSTQGDQLGRGILSCANWAPHRGFAPHREHPRVKIPLDAPDLTLNPLTVKTHNIFRNTVKTMRAGFYQTHYEPFLYPLDGVGDWNRLYGSKGFYQYQCVLPPPTAREGVRELLQIIAASGAGSPLAVLKDFGTRCSPGLLSFPMEGTTLALDFRNQGERTLTLMADLDAVVLDAGGRLYCAKDGRIPKRMFEAGYPQLEAFRKLVDPGLSSGFWKRMTE